MIQTVLVILSFLFAVVLLIRGFAKTIFAKDDQCTGCAAHKLMETSRQSD